ncbi:MAG TPA: hypothetical protein VM925_04970 [Labilithrix sp.]|nr:hypothetical protein [Labilithrix sp.]
MRTAHFSTTFKLALGLPLAAVGCADARGDLSDDETVESTLAAVTKAGGSSTPTGPCTVISGANKGKHGTFDEDGDCAGDWGMSECKNQDGSDSGKCKAGRIKVGVRLPRQVGPGGVHRDER